MDAIYTHVRGTARAARARARRPHRHPTSARAPARRRDAERARVRRTVRRAPFGVGPRGGAIIADSEHPAPTTAKMWLLLVGTVAIAAGAETIEKPKSAPTVTVSAGDGRRITLEAVGPAFRVGVSSAAGGSRTMALPTLMLPESRAGEATNVTIEHWPAGAELDSGIGLRASFGAIFLANHTSTKKTVLVLLGASGREITRGSVEAPAELSALGMRAQAPSCESAGTPNTDKANGQRLKASVEDLKSDCCAACTAFAGCSAWIFATDVSAG
eukprot:COSAG02_NODE_15827_length_1138_cov_1.446583_1_plen_271_part_10